MRRKFTLAFLLAITVSISTARAADCDRECLRGTITQYLDAMVAHKPGSLSVSDKVCFTWLRWTKKWGSSCWG